MKNIFSYKVEKDSVPEFNGNVFVTKRTTEEQQLKMLEIGENARQVEKKYSLPLFLKITEYIMLMAAVIILVGILNALTDGTPFPTAFGNAPALFIIGPICLVGWLALLLIDIMLKRKGKNSDEVVQVNTEADEAVRRSREMLEVPPGARPTDFIALTYKENKNGKVSPLFRIYSLEEYSAYVEGEYLCLADMTCVLSIPLSSLKGSVLVNKRLTVNNWNKEEKINSPKYKKYAVTYNGGNMIKLHYVINVSDARGEFELLLPAYEYDDLCELTGYRISADT